MDTNERIRSHLEATPEPRRSDLAELHRLILSTRPDVERWFFDGRDENGRVVSNPSIGYGRLEKQYAKGPPKPFYQVGISANSSGLTVYLMGVRDRAYLQQTYGATIGKAELTGYCIKFKRLRDIDQTTLLRAIEDGFSRTQG